MKKTVITLLLSLCALVLSAQRTFDRSELLIGTYTLQSYARTEAHIADLAACGIDFVVSAESADREMLDLFAKYNIGAVVNDVLPGWWGGDGSKAGQLRKSNPMSDYEKAIKEYKDHPAVWMIDIGDEPSALDFPYYGEVYSKVRELMPGKLPYLNLYPNYASVAENTASQTVNQLGTRTYAEHIAEYCRNVPSDYLCYDFYLYAINVPKAFENLRIVSDACLGSGRDMWIVLQVNSNRPEEWITEAGLRYQAYTAMAFGTQVITWACYTAGWWHNQVLDDKGNKTQQYDKLKRVNAELHRLGPEYMKFRRVSTSFVDFQGTGYLDGVGQSGVCSFNDGFFTGLETSDGSPLVVGSMISKSGDSSRAVFVCAADDPYDKAPAIHNLHFNTPEGREPMAFDGNGKVEVTKAADGSWSLPIRSNCGVLIEIL